MGEGFAFFAFTGVFPLGEGLEGFVSLTLEGFAFFGFASSFFDLPTEATRVCFLCDAGVATLTPLATAAVDGLEVWR